MGTGTIVELGAVATGLLTVYLTVRQHLWCWPTGIVNALLFALVFFEARLYGSMALQGVYLALSVYGWWQWRRPRGTGAVRLQVGWTPFRWRIGLGVAGVFASLLAGGILGSTGAALPYVDASTTAFSLVAQYLLARKWIETWIIWMTVDVVYVGLYASQGLHPTAALSAAFLGLAAAGWRSWRRSMAAADREAAGLPAVGLARATVVPDGSAESGRDGT